MRVEEITDSKKLTAIKCFPSNYETFKVVYIGLFHSCSLSGMLQFVRKLVFPVQEGKGVQCLIWDNYRLDAQHRRIHTELKNGDCYRSCTSLWTRL